MGQCSGLDVWLKLNLELSNVTKGDVAAAVPDDEYPVNWNKWLRDLNSVHNQ